MVQHSKLHHTPQKLTFINIWEGREDWGWGRLSEHPHHPNSLRAKQPLTWEVTWLRHKKGKSTF